MKKHYQIPRILMCVIGIFLMHQAYATSYIAESSVSAGYWNYDTVLVQQNVSIDGDLTITAGTLVLFEGYYSISVVGFVTFNGTQANPIIFRPVDGNENVGWGGIRFTQPSYSNPSSLKYCEFHWGKANVDLFEGGAIKAENHYSLTIENCLFKNNHADEGGGAIYMYMCSGTIKNCFFTQNTGQNEGGSAVWFENSDMYLTQNVIVNNNGPNIIRSFGNYNYLYAYNNTIANNDGHPFFLQGISLEGKNNIIDNNSNSSWFNNCENVNLDNNLLSYGVGEIDPTQINFITYYNNIEDIAQFVSPTSSIGSVEDGTSGDWSLTNLSSAINNGTPDTSILNINGFDIALNPRVYNGTYNRIDIGAYEFQANANSSQLLFSCDYNATFNNQGLEGYNSGTASTTPNYVNSRFTNQQSLEFDGTTQFLTYDGLNSIRGTDQFSASFWMSPEEMVPATEYVLFSERNSGNNWEIGLIDNKVYFRWWTGASEQYVESGANFYPNTWQMVTVIYNGTEVKFYKNNVLNIDIPASGTIDNNASNLIVGSYNGTANFYFGLLSDVKFYNKPISDDKIWKLYSEPGTQGEMWNNITNGKFLANMNYYIQQGTFIPETDWVEVTGDFNGWEGSGPMQDMDGNGIYEIQVYNLEIGNNYEFKFRINGNWTGLPDLDGGPNRNVMALNNDTYYISCYNDICIDFDLTPLSISNPMSGIISPTSIPITIEFKNVGSNEINDNIIVSYSLNSGVWVRDTIFGASIPVNDLYYHAFSQFEDFSTFGIYDFEIALECASDNFNGNDTIHTKIMHIPVISTFPSMDNFEATNYWTIDGQNISWELGIPNKGSLTTAASGANVWATHLETNHNLNELSYVYSPYYYLNGEYGIGLDIWRGFAQNSGAFVQMYNKAMDTWEDLNIIDSIQIFNQPNFNNGQINKEVWSGKYEYWDDAIFKLMPYYDTTRFRVGFVSDNFASSEGFAFDNFEVFQWPQLQPEIVDVWPLSSPFLTAAEVVGAKITNLGYGSIDAGYLNANGNLSDLVPYDPLYSFESKTVDFSSQLDVSTVGSVKSINLWADGSVVKVISDTVFHKVNKLRTISTFPFIESFEDIPGLDSSWFMHNIEYNHDPIWEIAQDTANPVYDGTYAVATKMNQELPFRETAYLESPAFDLNSIDLPVISFYMKRELTEYGNAVALVYRIGNAAWQYPNVVDEFNWMTEDSNMDEMGQVPAWANAVDDDWVLARAKFPDIAYQTDVQFKFIIKCTDNWSGDEGFMIDYFKVENTPANDLSIAKLINPVCVPNLGIETISIDVYNNGLNTTSGSFDVSYSINGTAFTSESISPAIAPSSSFTHNFISTYDFSATNVYEIVVAVSYTGDLFALNDTSKFIIANQPLIASFPIIEDFEGANNWMPVDGGTIWVQGTPAGTNVNQAYSGDNALYTYLVDKFPPVDGFVESPWYDFTGITNPGVQLMLWRDLGNDQEAGVQLQVSLDSCKTWNTFGDQSPEWYDGHSEALTHFVEGLSWFAKDGYYMQKHNFNDMQEILGGNPAVKFRLAFVGNMINPLEDDGYAFDDIVIYDATYDGAIYMQPFTNDNTNIETLTFDLTNSGIQDFSNFDITITVDGNAPVVETFTGTLVSGDVNTYTTTNTFDLSASGNHHIEAYIAIPSDGNQYNDTVLYDYVKPLTINTFPYFDNFEGANNMVVGGMNPSWEIGTPSGNIIDFAYSGINSWMTQLTNGYNPNELSYIETPTFDFNSVEKPIVEFVYWAQTEDLAAISIEISPDGGVTWENICWNNVSFYQTCYPVPGYPNSYSPGIQGQYAKWRKARFISPHGFNSNVKYRIYFTSSPDALPGFDGVAIDDLYVYDGTGTDLEIVKINQYNNVELGTNMMDFSFELYNYGLNGANDYMIYCVVDGGDTTIMDYTGDFICNDCSQTTSANVGIDLSGYGPHTIKAWVYQINDINPRNDTIAFTFINSPGIWVETDTTLNMNGMIEWMAKPNGDQLYTSWINGEPDGSSVITSPGNPVWKTGIGSESGFREKSYLYSPGFSLVNLDIPIIEFDIWRDLGNEQVVNLQYYKDGNWWNIGMTDDPDNWYTPFDTGHEDLFMDMEPFDGSQEGWTNVSDAGWVTAKHLVPELAHSNEIQFRFAYHSRENWDGKHGFAFDNFRIYNYNATTDIGVLEMLSPFNGVVTATDTVRFRVKNLGSSTIDSLYVSVKIFGSEQIFEALGNQNLLPDEEREITLVPTLDFSSHSHYQIEINVTCPGDEIPQNNYVEEFITKLLLKVVDHTIGFQDSFEGSVDWLSMGDNNSWAMGVPTAPIINSASDGTQCWVTNLSGGTQYEFSELLSPAFDLTDIYVPQITFSKWSQTNPQNGALFQYSIDEGKIWKNISNDNLIYNDNEIYEFSPNYQTSSGWSGMDAGWIPVAINLPEAALQPAVIFRFGFSTISEADSVEGFAIDNFQIQDIGGDNNASAIAILTEKLVCSQTEEMVSVLITNTGRNTISNFDVAFEIEDQDTIFKTVTETLNPLDTFEVIFDLPITYLAMQQKDTIGIRAYTLLSNDDLLDNDTIYSNVWVHEKMFEPMPGWENFNVCDGLYGVGYFAIDQDIYGRIWVATMRGGVHMKNGNNVQTFGNVGITDGDYSWALTAAPDGKVWWSSAIKPEIYMFQNSTLNTYTPVPDIIFEEYIYAATNGNVWFASYQTGDLLRYDGTNWDHFTDLATFGFQPSSIGELPDHTIVISSYNNELFQFNGTDFQPFMIPNNPTIHEIYYDTITNETWFGGASSLYVFDGSTWTDHSGMVPDETIYDIDRDKYGKIWIVTQSNKAISFDGTDWQIFTEADGILPSNGLFAVCGLNDGRVAMGSYGNGISVFANGVWAAFGNTIVDRTVTFTDQSVGTNLSYLYDFGDGTASTLPNPIHTYGTNGTYSVCLTVTNDQGLSNTNCKNIHIGDSATILCDAFFEYLVIEDSVFFFNYSSDSITDYFWDFGNNTFSEEKEPFHVYTQEGFYEVRLTVYDSVTNCIADHFELIEITGVQPSCFANFFYEGSNTDITFYNTSLGEATHYLWSFGDGNYSSDTAPTYTYTEGGIYEVCLSVYNENNNCTDEFCQEVLVEDGAVTICQSNFSFIVNEATVSFKSEPIGNVTNYLWHFGDGTFSTDSAPVHTYIVPDFYPVELTVYDSISDCLDTRLKTVIVTAGSTNLCNAQFEVFVDSAKAIFTNTSSGNYTDVFWDFGDGNFSTDSSPTHTYMHPDFYMVCISVFDSVSGCFDEFCDMVTITSIGTEMCNASFDHYTNNLKVNFTGKTQGKITDYFWDFGDGSYGFKKNVEHTYEKPGYYEVLFSIFNDTTNCMDETFDVVVVIDTTQQSCNARFESHATKRKVNFASISEGNYTDLFWDLGDGNYSTDSTFVHTYKKNGYYGVELTMYNEANDCIDSYFDIVVAIDSNAVICQAGFENHTKNLKVTFTNKSKGNVTDYFWDFGDGYYSTDTNTVHTYESAGFYEVVQTVFNINTNCMDEYLKIVKVVDTTVVTCNAKFSYYPNGSTVAFTSQATGGYKQIFWDFADGTNSNHPNPVHVYSKPGYYNVSLTVIDTNTTCFDTKFKVIFVEGQGGQEYGKVNAAFKHYPAADSLKVFFNNNSIGDVTHWYWDFGDNTPASNDTSPTHIYVTNDYYRVCQTVSNPINLNTKCKFIPVGDVSTKNTAFFTYYADSITATAHFKNKSLGNIVSYHWDFGDGYSSVQKNPAHTYADTGYYAVCLITTSSEGRERVYCKDVRIGNALENPCLYSCVWPGDANNDLEANHYDMLTIGLNYALEGPFREDATTAWYGQFAQNWSTYQLDGTNNKHGDCNGDGIINADDTIPIHDNFAFSHYYQPEFKMPSEWEIFIEWDEEDTKAQGSRRKAKAILTQPGKAAGDIYGIGYEIEVLNGEGIKWDSVGVQFDGIWLGTEGDDLLTFYSVDKDNEIIYISSVRTDHNDVNGEGDIAYIYFVFEEGYNGNGISFNVTTLGGIESDGITVEVSGNINLDLGADVTICAGDSVTIEGPEGFASYSWNTGSEEMSISVKTAGEFILTVSDTAGNTAVDTVIVSMAPMPEIDLGANIQAADSTILDAGANFASYVWNTADTTQTITVKTSGWYYVTVTNEYGCVGNDSINVTITGIFEQSALNSMVVYPNPNNGSFWIIIENNLVGEFRYDLLDQNGKLIDTKEFNLDGKLKQLVKPDYLPQGVYFLRTYYNNNINLRKVIVH